MNSREFDVLLRHMRHGTDEVARTMTVMAVGGITGGVEVLPGLCAPLKEAGLMVSVRLNRNQE
ncbi:hypothetical protein TW86_21560 [Halomonas sp. S2151]|nr:hypothetical protein TW86_21560 [Halomonas sp. S2151]